MQVIRSPAARLALHDVASTRALERVALAQLPVHTLMRRAGEAVARLAIALAPHARRIWIATGPGNNGGDGFEAALHLHRLGRDVRVQLPDRVVEGRALDVEPDGRLVVRDGSAVVHHFDAGDVVHLR